MQQNKGPLGHGFRNAVPLTASKILQQVWEDENTTDPGLLKTSLTWDSGQAEVGGQGSYTQERSGTWKALQTTSAVRGPHEGPHSCTWGLVPGMLCVLPWGSPQTLSEVPN